MRLFKTYLESTKITEKEINFFDLTENLRSKIFNGESLIREFLNELEQELYSKSEVKSVLSTFNIRKIGTQKQFKFTITISFKTNLLLQKNEDNDKDIIEIILKNKKFKNISLIEINKKFIKVTLTI